MPSVIETVKLFADSSPMPQVNDSDTALKSAGEVAVNSAETTFTLAEAAVEPVRPTVTVRVVPLPLALYVSPEKYIRPAEADPQKSKQAENISQYA